MPLPPPPLRRRAASLLGAQAAPVQHFVRDTAGAAWCLCEAVCERNEAPRQPALDNQERAGGGLFCVRCTSSKNDAGPARDTHTYSCSGPHASISYCHLLILYEKGLKQMLSYARDRLTSHLCTRRTGATRGALFLPPVPSASNCRRLHSAGPSCHPSGCAELVVGGQIAWPVARGVPGCAFRAPDRSQARWPWLPVSASPKSRIRLFLRALKR